MNPAPSRLSSDDLVIGMSHGYTFGVGERVEARLAPCLLVPGAGGANENSGRVGIAVQTGARSAGRIANRGGRAPGVPADGSPAAARRDARSCRRAVARGGPGG